MTDADRLAALETTLHQKMRSAYDRAKQPLGFEDIQGIVQQVIGSLSGDITAADLRFYSELEELATYIRNAKIELASIKPKDISTDHVPTATDELDAVVGATEEATNKIMDICDEISVIANECTPEVSEKLIACTTRVFEACNFQDITGQRITKVVQTLKYIDGKVVALLAALGEDMHRGDSSGIKIMDEDPEKALLNGPQLAHIAIGQDAIDQLMSET